MIRTTCPKCGREEAVADYLATLPILCNGCGTRVTIGERISDGPLHPPPVVPPPPPVEVSPPPPEPEPIPLTPPPPEPESISHTPPAPERELIPLTPPPPERAEVPEAPVTLAAAPIVSPPDHSPFGPVATPPAPGVAPSPAAKPVPLKPVAVGPPPAGVGRRLLARFLLLIGMAVMVGLGFGVLVISPKWVSGDPYIKWAILAAFPAIYLLVNAAMLARSGQDIGKRYTGVRVVNADGSKATEKTALLKRDALTLLIGLTGIGLLYWLIDFATLFGKGGQTLHDRIAGTRVVRA